MNLESMMAKRAVEVELSGRPYLLRRRAQLLKESGKEELILVVPVRDFAKAEVALRATGTNATIRNLTGSLRKQVE